MNNNPSSTVIISSYSDYGIGGLATYIKLLTEGLQEQGAKVEIIARFYKKAMSATSYADSDIPNIVLGEGHQTHIVAPHRYWKPALRQLSRLTGVPFLQGTARRLYSLALGGTIQRAFPKKVDVVHYVGTGWELLGYIALSEARKRGAAFTIWPAVHPGEWGDGNLDLKLYCQADAIFTQSDFEKDHLISLGIAPEILHRCGLCPATESRGDGTQFREKHGLEDKLIILFIGRKDKGKGYHALREALPDIIKAVPNACLCAIGPNVEPPYSDVPENSFIDMGTASEQEKADALAACDVFCMPSTSEAFGIVYVEAWANSKPVVAGMAPAVQELVEEGVDGYCVSQRPADIAERVTQLLRDPEMRQRMGQAGFVKQQKYYTKDAIVKQHNAVFQNILSQIYSRCS